VLKSSKKVLYSSLPKKRTREGGLRKKVSQRSNSSRKGKVLAEGRAKKFEEGAEERRK